MGRKAMAQILEAFSSHKRMFKKICKASKTDKESSNYPVLSV